jgi:tetratricopeptide (TPR) repeat protein
LRPDKNLHESVEKMPEVNGKKPFEERVNIILDELSLGIRWERPSLIVAVYRSEHIKNAVQAILAKSLGESGQAVLHYSVDKSHYDIPLDLLNHPNRERAVYFVSELLWGGGRGYSNAYRALNMHREYLVEGHIRALFWLTKKEAKQVTRFSPDFWAFRHKVVEFLDLPILKNKPPLESSKHTFHKLYTRNDNDFRIWVNKAGQLYDLGCIDEAIQTYRKAFRKYPDQTAINLKIAEIYLSKGWIPPAARILKKANHERTDKVDFLRELNRLNLAAHSIRHTGGGFSDHAL